MTQPLSRVLLIVVAALAMGCDDRQALAPASISVPARVDFAATRDHAPPSRQTVSILPNGSIDSVSFEPVGALPQWLNAQLREVDGTDFWAIDLDIATTNLPEGLHTATLRVTARGASGETLDRKDILVALQVRETVTFNSGIQNLFGVKGSSIQSFEPSVIVLANGERWQVTSNQPWARVPAGIQQDSQNLFVTVDFADLELGFYEAQLSLVNPDDPTETDSIPIYLYVVGPTLHRDFSVLLGGGDGRSLAPAAFNFWLDTGTNAYPWTLSIQYGNPADPAWLKVDSTSGMVSQSIETLTLDADRTGLVPGTYHATLHLEPQVPDFDLDEYVDVTLNIEENRIVVAENGIALYQLPSRQRLGADLQVLSSRYATDVPWTAEVDQPWLTVTPSGMTGSLLHVEADADALPADALQSATVTIRSTDAAVDNEEQVRVSFWKTAADVADVLIDTPAEQVVANPALPWVHVRNGATLATYHLFTGAHVATFTLPYANAGDVGVSMDGRTIYARDPTTAQAASIEAASGLVTGTFEGSGFALPAYLRIKGHELPFPVPLEIAAFRFSDDVAVAPDHRRAAYVTNIFEPRFHTGAYDFDYTALGGYGVIEIAYLAGWDAGRAAAIALAAGNRHALIAVAEPAEFRLYEMVHPFELITPRRTWAVAASGRPNNVVARGDGLLIGGTSVDDGSDDLFLMDGDGAALGSWASAGGKLLDDRLALGADPNRLIVPTDDGHVAIVELPARGADLYAAEPTPP